MRSVIVVVGLAACGVDSSGGPYIPIDMFASALQDAQCAHLATCGLFRNKDACLQTSLNNNIILPTPQNYREAVLAGKLYYDGSRYAKCVAALAAVTCDRTD